MATREELIAKAVELCQHEEFLESMDWQYRHDMHFGLIHPNTSWPRYRWQKAWQAARWTENPDCIRGAYEHYYGWH